MKKALCLFAMVIAILIASLIHSRYVDKRQYNEKIENSKRNARIYMKQKYGIDVEVVDVSDYGIVTVNDGENDFHVDGRSDDYQAEEIENALLDMIKTDIPTAFKCELDSKMRYIRYDGNNLDEVLDGEYSLNVYCVNTDFEEVPVFDFLRNNIHRCYLYSFSSEEMLNDFIENRSYNYITAYAPFIDSHCTIYDSESDFKIETYNIQEYNDFMYLSYTNIDVNPEMIFEEIPESYFDWSDSEYSFISAYGLKENYDVGVWLPIPDDKKDKEFYWAFEYYDTENKKIQETEKCLIVDGYATHNFLGYFNKDVKFALICK